MSNGNKILLLGGAAVIGGAFLYGRAYYKAAQALQPELAGFKITGYDTNTATVKGFITVAVTNKSNFIFPVPRAAVDFYSQGTYIGRGILAMPQTIGPRGVYYIDINVNLTLEQSATLLVSIITTGKLPDTINYNGAIHFGKYSIPFASSYAISGKKRNLHHNMSGHNYDFSNIQPVGKGFFGNIYDQFKGKSHEAITFLLDRKEGECIGALHHPQVGYIDLVWGYTGTSKSDGAGLAKIAKYHAEVLGNLQEIILETEITGATINRLNLSSETHHVAIRLDWNGTQKTWLLTAFEKKK